LLETDIIKIVTSTTIATTITKNKTPVINQQQHQSNENDPLLDRKIEDVAAGLLTHYSNLIRKVSLSNKENALTIMAYVNAIRTEANLSDNYRMDLIRILSTFSNYFQHKLSLKHITLDNLLAFLDAFCKPESVDLLHK
jgi:hypothetical protein